MKTNAARLLACLLCAALAVPLVALATDVDGPDDCTRITRDYGDAPEDTPAYPGGVIGHFPSCFNPGAPGNQFASCPIFGTAPLATGYVRHVSNAATLNYWLGCPASGARLGIDPEQDAKMNSTGAATSFCLAGLPVDCIENAFGMSFGQDECYGSTDAGIASPLTFGLCTFATFTYTTFSCSPDVRTVFLNILVDFNHDGDWNDAEQACGNCVREWAVRNVTIDLPPGCFTQTSPAFLTGPTAGPAWMRITITNEPVNDDFPWAGSATTPAGELLGGETEDYPVTLKAPPVPCKTYNEFGDAPEGIPAYSTGFIGHFPTCIAPTAPGTPDMLCPDPAVPPPGPTGYVQHMTTEQDTIGYWLGCGDDASPLLGVDTDPDGRSWLFSPLGQIAACDQVATPDCTEPAFGMTFGQDECYGDADAGISSFVSFTSCRGNTVTTKTYSCSRVRVQVYLNVLVDWNGDGDWTDILRCDDVSECAPEWPVRNQKVTIDPGCGSLTSKHFLGGPTAGDGWMRVTLSEQPAPDDFPWNGTISLPGSVFHRGETEDYPVRILPTPVGVGDFRPQSLAFAPPAPNPATNSCAFTFSLPHEDEISLVVYDLAGRERARIAEGRRAPGTHTVTWDFRASDGSPLRAGLYLVRLRVGGRMLTRSVMHVK